jgi:two-component sensor histidine kinase
MITEEGALDIETTETDEDMTPGEFSPLHCDTTERSPLPVVYSDGLTHIVRYVNPAFCRLVGKATAELIGHPFALAVPEAEANGCIALLDRVYLTSATETLTDQEHAPSHAGSPLPGVYWSYVAWAVYDAQERTVGVMMQVTDTSAARYDHEKAVSISGALLLYGLASHEFSDVLREREEAVTLNETLQHSLIEQNMLTLELNTRLQRAMQETHHRVKNNLQIVSALAEVQMDDKSDTVPTSALQRIVSHVRTLAGLHDILTQQIRDNAAATALSTRVSLGQLLPLLQNSIGTRHLSNEIENVMLSINNSTSISLLVSELVSNAVKHGKGDIAVTLRRADDNVQLTVADAGEGFPEGFDPRKAANTGLDLILSLARHDLRGSIAFENRNEGGAQVVVTFPVPN